jgi:hypothetical protein
MSQELTSAAGTERTSTHEAPSVSADDQAEIDFWTAALEEHSNRAMLNISRQALAKLLGIIGKLRTEQREPVSQEAPNDWEGSYTMLRVKNMRPLCGVPKSKGRMSDLTWYAVESITCARCVRSFHRMQRENAATAGKVIDLMVALKTSLDRRTAR